MSSKTDRTIPVDPTAELLRLGAVNRELRAENERLHLELERHQVTGDYEMGQLHANAALEAEVERLRRERNMLVLDRDAFEKDVERLRAALEMIAAVGWPGSAEMRRIALDALGR
jgi:hypothetical protein